MNESIPSWIALVVQLLILIAMLGASAISLKRTRTWHSVLRLTGMILYILAALWSFVAAVAFLQSTKVAIMGVVFLSLAGGIAFTIGYMAQVLKEK